jgi:hypothetical protein
MKAARPRRSHFKNALDPFSNKEIAPQRECHFDWNRRRFAEEIGFGDEVHVREPAVLALDRYCIDRVVRPLVQFHLPPHNQDAQRFGSFGSHSHKLRCTRLASAVKACHLHCAAKAVVARRGELRRSGIFVEPVAPEQHSQPRRGGILLAADGYSAPTELVSGKDVRLATNITLLRSSAARQLSH